MPILFIGSAPYSHRHWGMISLPKKPMPPVPFAREAPLTTSVRLLHRHWGMISLPKKPMPPVPYAREAPLRSLTLSCGSGGQPCQSLSVSVPSKKHRHLRMTSLPKKRKPPVPYAREAPLPTIVRLSQSLMSVVTHGQEGSPSTPIILLRRTALLSPTLVRGRSAMRAYKEG